MNILLRHKFLVILFIVLIAGIGIGIYLLQNPQIFRSRASLSSGNWINAFTITDANGKPILCDTATEVPVCPTNTLTVNFKITDLSLLTNSNVLGETTDPVIPPPPPLNNQGTSDVASSAASSTQPDSSPTPTSSASSPTPVASPTLTNDSSIVVTDPVVATASASPVSTASGTTIQINDQNLPAQVGSSLAVVLSNKPEATSSAATYDVRVLVTMPGNGFKPYLAKFSYKPGGIAVNDPIATISAQPVSTGSAKVNQKPATPSANTKYDLNKDGTVNSVDSTLFLTKWRGKTFAGIDINGDGKVNIFDYSDLKKNFN